MKLNIVFVQYFENKTLLHLIMMLKRLNPWAWAFALLFLGLSLVATAQAPSNEPCSAPVIAVGNTPGSSPFTTVDSCCYNYTNFLGTGPACGPAVTNRDAWYKISGMTTGQQYNFLFIEKKNRQTYVEIYELPAGKDCSVAANYKIVKCAQSNAVVFFVGTPISATFTVPSATSSYYARFQRATLGDQAIEGDFCVVKSYVNEEPCTATLLVQQPKKGTNPISGQNFQAADWRPEVLVGPTCGPNNDVWYKFIPTTCDIEIYLQNLDTTFYEMQAAILRSTDGTCQDTMVNVTPCGGQPDQYLNITLSAKGLTIGQTYYVIVDGYAPPYFNATGRHKIELYTPPGYVQCPNITQSPCECGDPGNCPGLWYPNSQQGNTAVTLSVNPSAPGCHDLKPFKVPLAGGSNTAEFCYEYTAKPGETLLAFESIIKKDPTCGVVSTGYQVHEVNNCGTPSLQPVCKDYNGTTPVFAVEPGKTYRFCRTITTDGGDLDCLNKTYDAVCAYVWPMPATSTTNKTICNNETYSFGGTTYSTSGTYVKNLKSPKTGCDSTATLVLTVLPSYLNQVITTTTCGNKPVKIGTQSFDKTGTYKVSLKTLAGCDSIITLNLTVVPAYNIISNIRKCQGETYIFGSGAPLTATGTYTKTFTAINGCDSLVTLNLFIPTTPITSAVSKAICNGTTFNFGNDVLSISGTYTKIFKTPAGCDSTVTLALTIQSKVESNLTKTICFGQNIKIGTSTYNTSGTFKDVLKANGGCDSTINLKLTVLPELKNTVSKSLCFGDAFTYPGGPYTKSGTFKVVLKSKDGCDSTITLNLTIPDKANTVTISKNICTGDVVTINGVNYTASTSIKFKTANGCDSTVNLVINTSKDLLAAKALKSASCGGACDGSITITPTGGIPPYKIAWSTGQNDVYVIKGLCADAKLGLTITDAAGCKVTDNIVIPSNPPIVKNLTEKICQGNSIKVGNTTYSSSVKTTIVLKTVAGCDSTINLDLTVFDGKVTYTACGGPSGNINFTVTGNDAPYTYSIDGGTTFSANPNFTNVKPGVVNTLIVKGASGCQFLPTKGPQVTLPATPLTLNVVDAAGKKDSITLYTPPSSNTITATTAGGASPVTTSWSPKDMTKPENWTENANWVTYTVTATDANGCPVSKNILIRVLKSEVKVPQAFSPDGAGNKDNDIFTVYDPSGQIGKFTKFKVYSRWGELMYNETGVPSAVPGWNGKFKNEDQPSDTYIYLIEYTLKTDIAGTNPITISGNVSLLR
jgi:gliding motility-associated-like protein